MQRRAGSDAGFAAVTSQADPGSPVAITTVSPGSGSQTDRTGPTLPGRLHKQDLNPHPSPQPECREY